LCHFPFEAGSFLKGLAMNYSGLKTRVRIRYSRKGIVLSSYSLNATPFTSLSNTQPVRAGNRKRLAPTPCPPPVVCKRPATRVALSISTGRRFQLNRCALLFSSTALCGCRPRLFPSLRVSTFLFHPTDTRFFASLSLRLSEMIRWSSFFNWA